MKEVVCVSDHRETALELRAKFPGIVVLDWAVDSPSAEDITLLAKRISSETYTRTSKPTLTLLTDVYFDCPSSPYTPLPKFSEVDLCAFARAQNGRTGVMRITFAFTRDGVVFQTDERDIAGIMSSFPRGTAGTQLDRLWIPNGYRYTISELIECQPHLNRRERAYRIVGGLLGAQSEEDVYEAHITVEVPDGGNDQLFQDVCADLGIKAIHIELDAGRKPTHFITGSIHRGDLPKVEGEVERLAQLLQESGLRPTRRKIEAMVQNSLVPLTDNAASARPKSNYFEFHTKVMVYENQEIQSLQKLCRDFGAHLARSASNKLSGGYTQRFVTLRFHNEGRQTAEETFARLVEQLQRLGFQPTHILKEYVLVDTNLDLDAGWADSAIPVNCYSACDKVAANCCPFQADRTRVHEAFILDEDINYI